MEETKTPVSETPPGNNSDGDTRRKPGHPGRVLRGLIPWAVSIGIILYIVTTEDMAAVLDAFSRASAGIYVCVLIPFLLLLLVLEAVYLYLGFRWFAGVGRFADLLRARAATYLLTVISIFVGLGGLVVYGKRKYDVSYSLGTSGMLNELLHELASQCTLAMAVGLVLPAALVPEGALLQVRAVMVTGMIGVGFYLLCILVSRLSRYLPESAPRIAVLDPFVEISLWQYALFYLIKLVQNVWYGLFLAGLLLAFGIMPPLIVSIGFMQIIHLTRAIPVSAFGIGIDQIAIPVLFTAWEPADSPGLLLACSLVFTFTLIFGRALLGVPFVRGVFNDLVEREEERAG